MVDTTGEPLGVIKRERDKLIWGMRTLTMLGVGLLGWLGMEIKGDIRATADKVTKIETSIAVQQASMGLSIGAAQSSIADQKSAIDQLRLDLRALERRQDFREGGR